MPYIKRKEAKLPWVVANRPDRKGQDYAFYNSAAWRRLSASIRASHPVCEVCRAAGRGDAAQMVDHIIPIRQGGARYDTTNLMAMCHECHNRKSAKDNAAKGCLVPWAGAEHGSLLPSVSRSEIIKLIEG